MHHWKKNLELILLRIVAPWIWIWTWIWAPRGTSQVDPPTLFGNYNFFLHPNVLTKNFQAGVFLGSERSNERSGK